MSDAKPMASPKVFGGFTADELEAQYNLRARRPDYDVTVIPDWMKRSEAARARLRGRTDLVYGEGPKQKLDLFSTGKADAPTLVYFHGGYWQRGDKSVYSFLAEPFVANGAHVIVVGYDLCPSVSITRISEEAREALAWIWRNAGDLGIAREALTVMGHSAGGHITEMIMGTDFSALGEDLPKSVVRAGAPVSPLTELGPLRFTSLNEGPQMDAAEAERESPIHHPPVTDAPQLVVVGGGETDEFHRQARLYVDRFQTATRDIELYVVPAVDHFDELNVLARTDSPFFAKTLRLLST